VVLPQLRRVRWAVRATLVLGVAASVVANILHALDNPISQAIAAWPPLALLLTVELISRVPVHRRSLAFARLVATATIAGIAAWVSYWHMAGVAARYGETGASPYLLPLSVDGLIVVASICLVELGGRIASLEAEAAGTARAAREAAKAAAEVAASAAATMPARAVPSAPPDGDRTGDIAVPGLIPAPGLTPAPGTKAAASPTGTTRPERRTTAEALAEVAEALTKAGAAPVAPAFTPTLTRQPRSGGAGGAASSGGAARSGGKTTGRAAAKSRAAASKDSVRKEAAAPKIRRTPAETVATAAKIRADRPGITDAELAAELGISVSRWRTIRREAGPDDHLRLAA
jgi:Protein of unknown function (DUF2637)